MTNKEKEMYRIIRENPRISQNELALKLGITRSAVSVHISNLIKKGYIIGREYILSSPSYVVVIGAANVDIIGRSADSLISEDSNPGAMQMCPGGVGRNIAENLSRLGTSVKLISSIGDDTFGKSILETSKSVGIDVGHFYIKPGSVSSTYLAILGSNGEMKLALSDMKALDEMPLEHLANNRQLISSAEIIVIDAGLPEATIEYIMANFKSSRIFLDPVSVGKAKHAKCFTGLFDTIKANRLEAEYLTGIEINDNASLSQAGKIFMEKGTKRVFISLGRNGVYYCSANGEGIFPIIPVQPVNATGAGDAFMAGVVYSTMQGWDDKQTANFASAMSRIALMSRFTVSPSMSVDNVQIEMRKMEEEDIWKI